VLAYVHAIRGDEVACRHYTAEAAALARGDRTYPPDTADALGMLDAGMGRHDRAAAHLGTAAATAGDQDFHRWANLLEAQFRNGQPPAHVPAVVADHIEHSAELPLHAAIAWRLRGLAGAHGDRDADRCFEAALDLHRMVDSPLDTGRTHLAFGERLRRAGHRIRAREQLRLAAEVFTRVEAEQLAGRARDELTATGPPAAGLLAISRSDGVESLTPQEFQAARAVATGATNREVAAKLFLSTKTVEFHLSNVYRKLGVRTRTELAHRYPALTAASARS
jgi:DNA-binding CsgD family transcriptional regulator